MCVTEASILSAFCNLSVQFSLHACKLVDYACVSIIIFRFNGIARHDGNLKKDGTIKVSLSGNKFVYYEYK